MNKKITVIIPCYNVENYIDRCLHSVTNQTIGLESLSIICVNDASTDNTLLKLQEWETCFPENIALINCKENGKQGRARNLALEKVTTPYVAFVDGDDWVAWDMYERMYKKAYRYDCEIVYCGMVRDEKDLSQTQMLTPNSCSWLLDVNTIEERKKFIASNMIRFSCCDKLIRTSLLCEAHITFPEQLAYEDIYWGALLYLYANKLCIMEDKFYHYCVNESSTVLATNQDYHKDIFTINDLKWHTAIERGFMNTYSDELKFDYLITGYLSPLKILALRFTTDTYADYEQLYDTVISRVPDFATNPYLYQLSEFQQLQIQLLQNKLSPVEWKQLCSMIKSLS